MRESPTNRGSAATKGHRVGFPITVTLIGILALGALYFQPEVERNFKAWATAAVVLVAMVLNLIWFVFLSRFSWRVRLITVGAAALAAFGLKKSVRVDSAVDGTGLPKFVWRWTKPVTREFNDAPSASPTLALSAPVGAKDVPQFFGPERTGIVRGANLARDWTNFPPRELWRQPIGPAWSAFAVVGGRVYTQEQRGEQEAVTCYELLTGKLLWTHTDHARFFQWQGGEGPRATPTVSSGRVFTMGGTGILNCLDATTGQQAWRHDVLQENALANITWGISDSPLVFEKTVVVTGGENKGPTLFAYDRDTGALLWKAGEDQASYASPVLATLAGMSAILSVNATTFTAHDPGSGRLLLTHRWSNEKPPKASQPIVVNGSRVLLSAGYGIGSTLLEVSATGDGKLSATQLWKNLAMKTQFNSATARDGAFYGLDDGMLACVEIASGKRLWKEGRYGSGQTLLVDDDLIIIQSEPGDIVLVEATSTGARELGRLAALKSKTWNHPTLAGRYLLLRNNQEAVCYELPVQGS